MKPRFSSIHPKSLFLIAILLTVAALTLLQSRTDFLRNADADVLLRLRGPRHLSPKLLWVFIDENDIKTLGGWPVTRDYYGYLIHILTEKQAKVIGLDVLLDSPNRQYPEYDRLLADFIQTSGRVVLSNVLDETNPSGPSVQVNPLPAFSRGAAGVGFSNLGEESTVRSVPLVVEGPGGLLPSFGLALAQTALNAQIRLEDRRVILLPPNQKPIRIPVDKKGCMLLNLAGDVSSIRSVRLTKLLHEYETAPDSLDFTDQLVIAAATAPSLPVLRSTPLCSQLPASLIHATAVENILNQTWLWYTPFLFSFAWILAWTSLGWVLSSIRLFCRWMLWVSAGAIMVPVLSLALFVLLRMVAPLFLSLALFSGSTALFHRLKSRGRRQIDMHRLSSIEAQILVKESALAEAEQKLLETERRLAAEIKEKQHLSEAGRRLGEEKEAEVLELEKQIRDLKAEVESEPGQEHPRFQEIIHGHNSPMVRILQWVEKVAGDDIPVLIQGETGTGKEQIARAIHRASPRHQSPFVAVNCGALPESLLESELFGHEKGAFTGAHSQRKGRFELAHGGTLFLDEITETTPAFQARLFRVLHEGVFERVGGERSLQADVRIIAAHNKDLEQEVREKRFREDLYFRLKGFPINLPPLRNRREDIPVLVRFFVEKYSGGSAVRVSDAAMARLQSNRWPGNVRELENAIRRAVLLARSEKRKMIQMKDLPEEIQKETADSEPVFYHPLETQILDTLRTFGFSRAAIGQTARALGNRDRGTVTEYFRGLCFQFLVQHRGDVQKAASALAASDDPQTIARVKAKIADYVENVRASLAEKPFLDYTKPSCFKGLPQKFHPYLQRLIDTIL